MEETSTKKESDLSYLLEKLGKYRDLAEKYKAKKAKSQYNHYHYALYTGKVEAYEEIIADIYGEKYV